MVMPERLHQPALDRVKRQPDIVAIGRQHFEASRLFDVHVKVTSTRTPVRAAEPSGPAAADPR